MPFCTYLSLSHQFPLEVVELKESAPCADRPNHSNRPATGEGGLGDLLDLLHPVFPKAAATVHVAAAQGVRLVQPPIQDWGFPQRESLHVPMGGGPQGHA